MQFNVKGYNKKSIVLLYSPILHLHTRLMGHVPKSYTDMLTYIIKVHAGTNIL